MRGKFSVARNLRQESTWAEKKLWFHLRNRKILGHKFRRQQPFGPYILDFYCAEKSFAVEMDGGGHSWPEKRNYDKTREDYLKQEGVRIVRFWNSALRRNPDSVLNRIRQELTR